MQFRPPTHPPAAINIAPLVDVVFLLVIFFAVSTAFLESAGLQLELPSSRSTAPQEARELTVFLGEDGTLSFDGEIIDLEELGVQLRTALEARERKLVVLRADRSARHGEVLGVMDVIQEAGAEDLTLDAKRD